MDKIELSRQKAEELHNHLVADGKKPREPYAFARSEAGRRKIEVEKVPKGDVRLHGARALYDPEVLLILHEDTGDDFEHAFLVAHELGHVEFGGIATASRTEAIDPLRSSEASPVGVDRVVDYSRREREEVQMDLFAREFLLPRSWLRKLHLEQNVSATEIAKMCNAPVPVVAQQLLDALLLPAITLTATQARNPKVPDPDQRTAIQHLGKPFLLEAGPGTGKTQTLVGHVKYLLESGVAPSQILVLTFSNKAAGELSERLAETQPEAAAAMWIGTFHAFGLDLVRRFHAALGFTAEPRLLDKTEAIALLEDEYPKLQLVHYKNLWDPSQPLGLILNAISRANDEVVDAEAYRTLAQAMIKPNSPPEVIESAEKSLEVARVFATYERIKLATNQIDFGDLVAMPVRLCEQNAEIREHLRTVYTHVLVDEFQDVNRASVRLLKSITRDGENLWAVGDAKQSIYRFRGASSFNMTRFDRDDFPSGQRGRLTKNYRSVAEVRDSFVTFASGMKVVNGTDVSLEVDRGACEKKTLRRQVGTDDEEIAAVVESIEQMRREGHKYRDQAVLCSGNDRLARFARKLEQLKIPVLYLGSLFERSEIKDLICLLSVIVDRRAMGLLRLATIPQHTISLADVDCVVRHLRQNTTEPLDWAKDPEAIAGLSDKGVEGLRRLGELIKGFKITADPWTVLATVLLDRSRIAADIATNPEIQSRAKGIAIWQFMNFLKNQPRGKGLPITRLLERMRLLLLNSDERDLRQLPAAAQSIDAVRLMTMHGSKGLEFEVVHIPGLTAASLPRSPNSSMARGILPPDGLIEGTSASGADAVKESIVEEQECLFFVALSRARDRLFLYNPTVARDGKSRPPSSFLARLAGTVEFSDARPTVQLPVDEWRMPLPIKIDGAYSFTDHQLGLHERCPRRFLYAHILEIGGRRTETAFMRLHVAVQQVVNEISQRLDNGIPDAELDDMLEVAWQEHGPSDHGYSDEYKRIAQQLLRYYAESGSNLTSLAVPELRLPVGGGEIVVTPDQLLQDKAGHVHMRRVRTGHKKSKEDDSLRAAAFHLAATAHTPGCKVQLVHLSDETVTPVSMTTRVLKNRRASIELMLSQVMSGLYPLDEDITCPRCPAFFVCGSVPPGPLLKKLEE